MQRLLTLVCCIDLSPQLTLSLGSRDYRSTERSLCRKKKSSLLGGMQQEITGMDSQEFGWGREEGGWRKGPWTAQEDKMLLEYVRRQGEGRWNSVAKLTGLKRSGKSCRLRWVNYLRPDLKRGKITPQEETVILELHALWGNRWSTIARSLPGRTDNEIKNYWRTHFKKGKPSKNIERARARFLKQRREMRGHHPGQHGDQAVLLQDDQDDVGGGAAAGHHADQTAAPALTRDEIAVMQDMLELDDFLSYHPMPSAYLLDGAAGDGGPTSASASEAGSSEEIDGGSGAATWGSLWNLDGVVVDDVVVDGGACCWDSFPLLQDQGLVFY